MEDLEHGDARGGAALGDPARATPMADKAQGEEELFYGGVRPQKGKGWKPHRCNDLVEPVLEEILGLRWAQARAKLGLLWECLRDKEVVAGQQQREEKR